jgi:D-serine deaminase-like pyridoxal phosphate-dependent protein
MTLYERYRRAIAGEPLPLALVDLDALDANIGTLVRHACGRPVRLATKSIRCPTVLEHILEKGGSAIQGLMTYTALESAFWAQRGQRDLLLAYPTVQASDAEILARLNLQGVAAIVVDDVSHLDVLSARARPYNATIPVVVDVDVEYRPFGRVEIGVRRSPLRSPRDVVAFARRVRATPHVSFHGVMAYEAQIAGLPERAGSVAAPFVRALKARSQSDVSRRRAAISQALREAGFPIRVFNGGGLGSVPPRGEPHLTEMTAGSGFVGGHLSDRHDDLHITPALYFALQVVRRPSRRVVTCLGGGYVASGGAGKTRLPIPTLPAGLSLLQREGAGEVQTPLVGRSDLHLGDPVFFRHAKAGELAEHFDEYLLVRDSSVVQRAKTYRGLGECFLG